jgi:hypothetical protein
LIWLHLGRYIKINKDTPRDTQIISQSKNENGCVQVNMIQVKKVNDVFTQLVRVWNVVDYYCEFELRIFIIILMPFVT